MPPQSPPPFTRKGKGKADESEESSASSSEEEEEPKIHLPPTPLVPGPSKPQRECRVPTKPGNVYGESRHPTDILNQTRKLKDWKGIVGERTSCPQQRKAKDAPQQPEPDSEEDQLSEEEEKPSEDEVEWTLSKEPTEVTPQSEPEESKESGASSDEEEDAEAHLVQLCDEGGVVAINFLLSKAVSPTTMDVPTKSPKEWTYRDIARLPEAEQKEWRTACHNELDALKR